MLECEKLLEFEKLQVKDKITNALSNICEQYVKNDTSPARYFDDLKELFKMYLELENEKKE